MINQAHLDCPVMVHGIPVPRCPIAVCCEYKHLSAPGAALEVLQRAMESPKTRESSESSES